MHRKSLIFALFASWLIGCAAPQPRKPTDLAELIDACTEAFSHYDTNLCVHREFWPAAIRRLEPVRVYAEGHGAIIIAQSVIPSRERGIYVHLPFSSSGPPTYNTKPKHHYQSIDRGVYWYAFTR